MKYSGLLGAPRLSSFGPLVAPTVSAEKSLDKGTARNIVGEVADENDLPANDLSEEEAKTLVRGVADRVYPPEDPVSESKNARFQICLSERWANAWADGLAESENTDITFNDALDKVALMATGCVAITEANTADSELIIPEAFKE